MNLIAIYDPQTCMHLQAIRDPCAKMLKSHPDQIRLISISKSMQHNDAISLLKIDLNDDDNVVRTKTLHKLDRRLIESTLVRSERLQK